MKDREMKDREMKDREMYRPETNELERILAHEETLQPMTGFSTRVMRAVREEAEATPPIAFPWARFLPGFALNLALLLGAALWVVLESVSASPTQPGPTDWLSDPLVQGLSLAALTVLGTGVLAWVASRWIAPRSTESF